MSTRKVDWAKLLDMGLEKEQECAAILKVLSPELPEYEEVLTALGKVRWANDQIRAQMAERARGL